jgi:hypothetical protein
MNGKLERKLIDQLKKLKRVEMTHLVRLDDATTAYYCEETDEIIMFVDVIVVDAMTHFKVWGESADETIEQFIANFVGTRTPLHEMLHYCGVNSSKQCEYLAVKYTWYSEVIARIVANWLYPYGKIAEVVEVELD